MREAIVILIVIAVLLALTAIKYRRQIVTLIGFYKQVQAIRSGLKNAPAGSSANKPLDGIQLVKCERCGKWVSETQSVRNGSRIVCADNCQTAVRV
jgi:hypothetical protein